MANINKELNQIKNAVYGREVRDAIHDGIEKAYNDATSGGAGDTDLEVVLARGKYDALNKRLDASDSQLAEKATQSDVDKKRDKSVPITLNDADQDMISAIEGGEGTSFNLLSVPKNHSVTPLKTTFFDSSKNLFHGDLVPGFIYDQDDPSSGRFEEPTTITRSCIIKVEPNETYTITPFGGDRKIYAVYEDYPKFGDEAILLVNGSNHNENPVTFTNPSNGRYLALYLSSEGLDIKCQVEKGSESTKYVLPFKFDSDLLGDFSGRKIKNKSISKEKTDFIFSTKNLYHGDLVGGWLSAVDDLIPGKFNESGRGAKLCIIEINAAGTYTITPYEDEKANIHRYAIFANYPEYEDVPIESLTIGDSHTEPITFTSPSNGRYLVVDLSSEGLDIKCQVEKGSESTKYVLPFKFDEKIKVKYDTNDENLPAPLRIKDKYHVYSTFELDYKPPEQEPANEDGSFNALTSNHTDIYRLFDYLMEENTDYIKMVTWGEDDYGNSIQSYKFNASGLASGNDTFPVKKLKILLTSGMHGDERTFPYVLYKVAEELTNRYGEHEFLNYLRRNVELIITPVMVPSGHDDETRRNRKNLDINRNFENNWETAGNYKGSAPFSEKETQAIKKMVDENMDAEILIDFHNYTSPRDHFLWAPIGQEVNRPDFNKFIYDYFSMITGRWSYENEWLDFNEVPARVSVSTGATLRSYGTQNGILSHTAEIRDHIPQKPNNKRLDETNIEFAMEYAVNMIAGFINTL